MLNVQMIYMGEFHSQNCYVTADFVEVIRFVLVDFRQWKQRAEEVDRKSVDK